MPETILKNTFDYSEEHFERLRTETYDKAHSMAMRLTKDPSRAEDLMQMTYLRAWQGFESYKPEHPFLNWLLRIMHNAFCDMYRRRNALRNPASLEDISVTDDGDVREVPVASSQPTPEDNVMLDEMYDELIELLEELPEPYLRALYLREIDGLSYDEIASLMDDTVGAVRSRLHRGRKMLKQMAKESDLNVPALVEIKTRTAKKPIHDIGI